MNTREKSCISVMFCSWSGKKKSLKSYYLFYYVVPTVTALGARRFHISINLLKVTNSWE